MQTNISVELCSFWSAQSGDPNERPARAAWVSTTDREKAEAKSNGAADRVIRQLVRSQPPHKSPLEFVYYEFWLRVPISIERQLDKHRISVQEQDFELTWYGANPDRASISQNELSGRYRTMPDEWMKYPADLQNLFGLQSEFELHMRDSFAKYHEMLERVPPEWKHKDHPQNKLYKRLRETIRNVLPLGTMTQMRIVLNLSALQNLITLRLHPDAQPEAQLVAAYMVYELMAHNAIPAALAELWHPHATTIMEERVNNLARGLNPDE